MKGDRQAFFAFAAALAASAFAPPFAFASEPVFVAPDGPMILTRALTRDLPDGKTVVLKRTWRIRFVPEGDGYRIDGTQIALDFEAPPKAAPVVEAEKRRPHDDTFPMILDRRGFLVDQASAQPLSPDMAKAAQQMAKNDSPEFQADVRRFVVKLRSAPASATTLWPQDVFFPVAVPREETRDRPLPDGTNGSVTIRMSGSLDDAGDRMNRFERTIVTRIGGRVSHSWEVWTLAPES